MNDRGLYLWLIQANDSRVETENRAGQRAAHQERAARPQKAAKPQEKRAIRKKIQSL